MPIRCGNTTLKCHAQSRTSVGRGKILLVHTFLFVCLYVAFVAVVAVVAVHGVCMSVCLSVCLCGWVCVCVFLFFFSNKPSLFPPTDPNRNMGSWKKKIPGFRTGRLASSSLAASTFIVCWTTAVSLQRQQGAQTLRLELKMPVTGPCGGTN